MKKEKEKDKYKNLLAKLDEVKESTSRKISSAKYCKNKS